MSQWLDAIKGVEPPFNWDPCMGIAGCRPPKPRPELAGQCKPVINWGCIMQKQEGKKCPRLQRCYDKDGNLGGEIPIEPTIQARMGITDNNRWLLIVLGVVILWFANKKYKFI